MRRLTELDYCVLGVIWRSGPLSAYGVRSEFAASTTAAWSSSSGSIYPSIKRLAAAGLVTMSPQEDQRGTQALTITAEGEDRLRAWIVELPPGLGSPTPDPIRTRAQFLTSVPARDRAEFVAKAKLATSASLRELEPVAAASAGRKEDALEHLGDLGAILELRARLEWLDQVLDLLPAPD